MFTLNCKYFRHFATILSSRAAMASSEHNKKSTRLTLEVNDFKPRSTKNLPYSVLTCRLKCFSRLKCQCCNQTRTVLQLNSSSNGHCKQPTNTICIIQSIKDKMLNGQQQCKAAANLLVPPRHIVGSNHQAHGHPCRYLSLDAPTICQQDSSVIQHTAHKYWLVAA